MKKTGDNRQRLPPHERAPTERPRVRSSRRPQCVAAPSAPLKLQVYTARVARRSHAGNAMLRRSVVAPGRSLFEFSGLRRRLLSQSDSVESDFPACILGGGGKRGGAAAAEPDVSDAKRAGRVLHTRAEARERRGIPEGVQKFLTEPIGRISATFDRSGHLLPQVLSGPMPPSN